MDAYYLAYLLVAVVDAKLEDGHHYRDHSGRLLVTLEDVIRWLAGL